MRASWLSGVVLLAAASLAACDDDPNAPIVDFRVSGCPVAPLGAVNPIRIAFTGPVAPGTATGGNVVVSNAATGLEIPGALSLDPATNTIVFTPSERLPYGERVRVRVQNILQTPSNTAAPLLVCDVDVEPPPIAQLFWRELESPTGNVLRGVSIPTPNVGYVASEAVPLFKRVGDGDFQTVFDQPYYDITTDVAYANADTGFGLHQENRRNRGVVTRTVNGGATYDTVATFPFRRVQRMYARQVGNTIFGILAAGTPLQANLHKYRPATNTFTLQTTFSGLAQPVDIDFQNDTLRTGAAVTLGLRGVTTDIRGAVLITTDAGVSWTEVAAARGGSPNLVSLQSYNGVAVRGNDEIWAVGDNGYVVRLTRAGTAYTVTRVLQTLMTNPDSTTQSALRYTDIEFAPDNDSKGWLIGVQQIGIVNGVPKYQGFIFETIDGGQTWTRQGVVGVEGFGAEMPRLNRIEARSATHAWIVGDAGFVIEYAGANP